VFSKPEIKKFENKSKMRFRNIIILLVFMLVTNVFSFAQETQSQIDTTRIYEEIETYSKKSGFTRFMYGIFFKPVAAGSQQKKVAGRLAKVPYSTFEGKIIRKIKIETLDPFGNSIGDTITTSLNFLSRAGNRLHIKTQNLTVRNLLLFRENHVFDALLVKESERLVRSRTYITDVSFLVQSVDKNSDSVDITIRQLDSWSIIPGGSISSSRLSIRLRDNNFLGLGHAFQNGLVWNHSTGDYAYRTKYFIPNIRNTYINSTLQYGTEEDGDFVKSLAVDRPFFSPFAKWAAGVNFSQNLRRDSIWKNNFMPFKFNAQDYWAGSAIRIFRGNSEYSRTTNLITAARFLRIRYLERPDELIDTLRFFADEKFYMVSLGVSTRQYIEDNFIFKFGLTEDVPIGKVVSLTGGYQRKNNSGKYYLGVRYSTGSFYPWGYLSTNLEYGAFLRASKAEQGVFSASASYFTNLIEIGRWKLRQFVRPQLIIGINRTDYDTLTINDGYGLVGFNSPVLSGNSRILFTSQTQAYTPWNFIGFHFGPFLTISLGMLGDKKTGFRTGKLYSQIGLGVLIKNDHLVMNAFQISIAFYPIIPGIGINQFKLNSFNTSDFGFRDFEIGKPAPVRFR
jgi:hypothetical protein